MAAALLPWRVAAGGLHPRRPGAYAIQNAYAIQKKTAVIRLSSMVLPQ